MGIESENFHEQSRAFAEARGQSGQEIVHEIVMEKFRRVGSQVFAVIPLNQDPPDLPKGPEVRERIIFNPGTCSI